MSSETDCALCKTDGGRLIWRGAEFRLIWADDALLPAFYRVVWNAHVAEFSDLTALQRLTCLDAVALAEQLLRETLAPDKINLASLGNVVPHLHWHVIARWRWDAYWPQSAWSAAQRPANEAMLVSLSARLPEVDAVLQRAFAQRFGGP
ncbi:putative Histidine triad (HIT) hydrolase [Thiomonas arsenitoxydans]|uniref:Histidine triad (HIT) hydrolase n=1 Tax=Thiomonas arsenitoxydans (strain DSM 22701 / CIP 110005 / 3As) TaxID=426114 RepID=D6CM63_THIA3|nr:HIT family protein [Thiomonas arsenitoxydans]CQR43478.1 putative Histidine triad (HIT) hydrolase [Thiomonas sp. CB3]CAZ89641.1 putative Histidine triad (HIT) hydrolase [Thiomonas arsenitoxydans]CQR26772.1 putative Histidine triad (HIT) hydrolase [Thiomonas arsenitoxydans]CQR36574.1 putative Histidine triad (HIT) hydrolase [Thiomonas arsenitoxydans]CQR38932.1 putative Histidine triad (HIT) hydrolase [Thiomonas arsenitoxydans]